MGEKIVTTQKTSKRYKLVRLLSWVVFLIGAWWLWGVKSNAELTGTEANYTVPIILIVVFVLMRLYARVGQWWNND